MWIDPGGPDNLKGVSRCFFFFSRKAPAALLQGSQLPEWGRARNSIHVRFRSDPVRCLAFFEIFQQGTVAASSGLSFLSKVKILHENVF